MQGKARTSWTPLASLVLSVTSSNHVSLGASVQSDPNGLRRRQGWGMQMGLWTPVEAGHGEVCTLSLQGDALLGREGSRRVCP